MQKRYIHPTSNIPLWKILLYQPLCKGSEFEARREEIERSHQQQKTGLTKMAHIRHVREIL